FAAEPGLVVTGPAALGCPSSRRQPAVSTEGPFVSVGGNGPKGRGLTANNAANLGRRESGHPLRPGIDGGPATAGVEERGERSVLHVGVGTEDLDHLAVGEDDVVDDISGARVTLHAGHPKTAPLWIVRGIKLWTTCAKGPPACALGETVTPPVHTRRAPRFPGVLT